MHLHSRRPIRGTGISFASNSISASVCRVQLSWWIYWTSYQSGDPTACPARIGRCRHSLATTTIHLILFFEFVALLFYLCNFVKRSSCVQCSSETISFAPFLRTNTLEFVMNFPVKRNKLVKLKKTFVRFFRMIKKKKKWLRYLTRKCVSL